ncbi:DUF922 domain-containing protein [Pararhizobium mangrovi]|uniref:DUF922 domain-containing protein n=1 Tax=Pararhizobium mangrovi TaxID=2590452 RepID=A0A506UHP6_9HYPH|nr:DUF922 domain-containing protein [Pararhizobium mangrovi]TPW32830.1 DUF922 domain-containing protein [Pararhizobium mangrovi]
MRCTLTALTLLATTAAQAETTQRTVTYPVHGRTGIALYRSIGENGPKIGGRRTIAHTGFDLTWTRDYRVQPDGACRLAVARPHLVVTTTVPKAPADLPPALAASWSRFAEGIRTHERVHARAIAAMVARIEAFSTGLTAPADPDCTRVRQKLQAFLAKTIARHRAESRAFDKADIAEEGGTMRQTILDLVNGP